MGGNTQAPSLPEALLAWCGGNPPAAEPLSALLAALAGADPQALDAAENQLADLRRQYGDFPAALEAQALLLARREKPHRAEPLLQSLLTCCPREKRLLLYALAESYQSIGWHKQALAVLDACRRQDPAVERDSRFSAYVRCSQKHQTAETPALPSGSLLFGGSAPTGRGHLPWGWLAAAAAVALLWAVHHFWVAAPPVVYLVNGSARPYACVVADQTVSLQPQEIRRIRVASNRDFVVKGKTAADRIAEQRFRIYQTALLRSLLGKTYVLNPDRLALFVTETVLPRDGTPAAPPPPATVLSTGAAWHEFSGVTDLFRELPEDLLSGKKTTGSPRVRLDFMRHVNPETAARLVLQYKGAQEARAYAALQLEENPHDRALLRLACAWAEKPSSIQRRLRSRLGERPVLLEWHLAYQDAMRLDPDDDSSSVCGEYQDMVKREPGNADLVCLLARVTPDRAEAQRLRAAAAAMKPPATLALADAARADLQAGRLEAADAKLREALRLQPGYQPVREAWRDLCRRRRAYDDLLADNRLRLQATPLSVPLLLEQADLLWAKGDRAAAANFQAATVARLGAGNPRATAAWQCQFDLVAARRTKNRAAYAAAARQLPGEGYEWEAAVAAGDVQTAAELMRQGAPMSTGQLLLTTIAAAANGKHDLVRELLQTTTTALAAGNPPERTAAAYLGQPAPYPPEAVAGLQTLPLPPEEKQLVLVLAGLRSPTQLATFLDQARGLSLDGSFASLILDPLLQPDAVR